eukprot:CAMPEP_0195628562 /NCGR_PEP_ID=MMETSP0815-20121206/19521_1 /TAXON_ID=97485 /ORGANISM="Prymnesium parvum, Strain Texoma1" /LENGTH=110 /DNA_ID=CAMNT_0040769851 /DNA_START=337 /DNA_END=668 /DNA_ORIENTATION=-
MATDSKNLIRPMNKLATDNHKRESEKKERLALRWQFPIGRTRRRGYSCLVAVAPQPVAQPPLALALALALAQKAPLALALALALARPQKAPKPPGAHSKAERREEAQQFA